MEPVVSGNGGVEVDKHRGDFTAVSKTSLIGAAADDTGVSGRRSVILISVDEISCTTSETQRQAGSDAKQPEPTRGTDPVQPRHYSHHHHQRHYPPWDSLRAQSLSRLETFVSTGGGGVIMGGRRCHDDHVDGNYDDDCKASISDLRVPTGTCQCNASTSRRRTPLRCPSFPHLMAATIRGVTAAGDTTSGRFDGNDHLASSVSFTECESASCCYCNCCCYCGGGSSSVDVDASSMSPRLSSIVDLSQDLELDIQYSRSVAAAAQREQARLMTSSSVIADSSSLLLGRSVSVRAVTTVGRETTDVDTIDYETPSSSSPTSGDVTSDGARENIVTILSSNAAAFAERNNASSKAKISRQLFPVAWKIRRSASCPSLATIPTCIPETQQRVSGFNRSVATTTQPPVKLSTPASRRRRSHAIAVDVNLEGEVVEDLPVAVKPNIIYPDFDPEIDVMSTTPVIPAQSPQSFTATLPVGTGDSTVASLLPRQTTPNCVRQRRQTMATSGDVRIKCLQWLNGLATDNTNLEHF